jgi:hypothetical protein
MIKMMNMNPGAHTNPTATAKTDQLNMAPIHKNKSPPPMENTLFPFSTQDFQLSNEALSRRQYEADLQMSPGASPDPRA